MIQNIKKQISENNNYDSSKIQRPHAVNGNHYSHDLTENNNKLLDEIKIEKSDAECGHANFNGFSTLIQKYGGEVNNQHTSIPNSAIPVINSNTQSFRQSRPGIKALKIKMM